MAEYRTLKRVGKCCICGKVITKDVETCYHFNSKLSQCYGTNICLECVECMIEELPVEPYTVRDRLTNMFNGLKRDHPYSFTNKNIQDGDKITREVRS